MLIKENITDSDRLIRDFESILKSYDPSATAKNIHVVKTKMGNWAVYDKNGKKIFLCSKNILTPETVEKAGLKVCDCPTCNCKK